MLKKGLLLLICLWSGISYASANVEDLLVLLPPNYGDISLINNQPVETIYVKCESYSDGVLHTANYKDGIVALVISATSSAGKKELGVQRIYRNKKEISKSKEYFLDTERENTIVHVHDKYIVYTSPDRQIITPRK